MAIRGALHKGAAPRLANRDGLSGGERAEKNEYL